jgi:pimeloyl-ACP methyl ester carboxylesterase
VGLYHPGVRRGYRGISAGGQRAGGADGTFTGRHHRCCYRESLPRSGPRLDRGGCTAGWRDLGSVLRNGRGQLAAWRALSGGTHPVEEIERLLLDAPEGDSTLREIFGEGSPIVHELAERLYHHDPDMLGMLIEDYDNVAAGYDMETVLPAIHCPVLLVQADPSAGGALTDEQVQRALHLLADPTHIRFAGMDHMLLYDPKGPPMVAVNAFLSQLSL